MYLKWANEQYEDVVHSQYHVQKMKYINIEIENIREYIDT